MNNIDMITGLLAVFSPLLTAGVAWLIRNSMNLSERVAVMDSKLSNFVTSEHLAPHATQVAVLAEKYSELVKRVEALEHR